jgi:hypothetical protein
VGKLYVEKPLRQPETTLEIGMNKNASAGRWNCTTEARLRGDYTNIFTLAQFNPRDNSDAILDY